MVYAKGQRRHLPEAGDILYISDPHRLVRNNIVHSPCAVKGVRVDEHYGRDQYDDCQQMSSAVLSRGLEYRLILFFLAHSDRPDARMIKRGHCHP